MSLINYIPNEEYHPVPYNTPVYYATNGTSTPNSEIPSMLSLQISTQGRTQQVLLEEVTRKLVLLQLTDPEEQPQISS